MPAYTAKVIDAAGRVLRILNFPADDDAAAIERVKPLIDGHDVELTEDTKLIVRFNAK